MASNALSAVCAATCLVAGCTGIIYGESEATSDDHAVSHGSKASSGGAGSPQGEPAPAAGGALGTAGDGSSAGSPEAAAGAEPSPGGAGGQSASDGGAPNGSSGEVGESALAGADGVGAAGAPAEEPLRPGDKISGFKLAIVSDCHGCHGSELAGGGFYPNITPDETTGVGSWSNEQLALAIVRHGQRPCADMPTYAGLSPQNLADLVAFLRSLPPKYNLISSVCAGHDR